MELFLIRHGETVWNAQKRLQGRMDIELNEKGRIAARELSKNLKDVKFDRIYSSPLKRAFETARILSENHNLSVIVDDRLKEISFGVMDGEFYSEWMKEDSPYRFFFTEPEKYFPPKEGESLEDLCSRTKAFIQNEIEPLASSCERIMIVAHGALNASMICYFEGNDKAHFWGDGLKGNCEVASYEFNGTLWKKTN